jgi:hypothetical protein
VHGTLFVIARGAQKLDVLYHMLTTDLTSLLAIAPEAMTVAQFNKLGDALDRVSGGHTPTTTLTTLLV